VLFDRQRKRALLLRQQPVSARKELLIRLEKFLLKNQERINLAIHHDFSKPFAEVGLSELYPVLTEIRHAIKHLDEWTAPKKIDAPLTYLGTRSEIRVEPRGVCLIISPWNFPFNLCFGTLISCLAAGNTAILKPSEMTPSAAKLIEALVEEFFDDDHVAVVNGGSEVAAQLLALPFDHIFFTGSPAVGKIVMKAAAGHLTSFTLELGGKSPVIIDRTADISDAAKRIAFGKFINNGQTCIAPDYVLVDVSIRDEFLAALKANVLSLFGDNGKIDEGSASYARIVDRRNFDRLERLLEDAIAAGARLEMSGKSNADARFMPPAIITEVSQDMAVMQEEIFGPILPVMTFSGLPEVISIINGKPKPLALYIFSKNNRFKEEVLSNTSAGSVCVNDCVIQFSHPNLPFGGIGQSGFGKAHGIYGFLAFSNEKPIVRQKRGFAALYLIYPPYTAIVKKLIDLMIKWF